MLKNYFNKIAEYLTGTFGANFFFYSILITTTASVLYFIVITYIITQMDKRYFLRNNDSLKRTFERDKAQGKVLSLVTTSLRFLMKSLKIVAGLCLLVCGIIMLVLPGQGLITILIGLSMLPFPGKNKMEENLLSRKAVRSSLNWMRLKAKKEPFIFD